MESAYDDFEDYSGDDDEEISREKIVNNYCLLNDKWLDVIDHNNILNQRIISVQLEKNDTQKKISELTSIKCQARKHT